MSEERLQEIKDSLNAQYEIAKSDNKYQSVYVVLDEEQELIEEIERLNNIINDINYYIEQRCNEDIDDTEMAILKSIELISKGIIKVVRGENKK